MWKDSHGDDQNVAHAFFLLLAAYHFVLPLFCNGAFSDYGTHESHEFVITGSSSVAHCVFVEKPLNTRLDFVKDCGLDYTVIGVGQKGLSYFICQPSTIVDRLLTGRTEIGLLEAALLLFSLTLNRLIQPNFAIIANILPVCASFDKHVARCFGRHIQSYALQRPELLAEVFVSTVLVCFYLRVGRMKVADILIWERVPWDLVSWQEIMAEHTSNGEGCKALHLCGHLVAPGMFLLVSVTVLSILPACAQLGNLPLASFYTKHGYQEAYHTFSMLLKKDLISCNSILDPFRDKRHYSISTCSLVGATAATVGNAILRSNLVSYAESQDHTELGIMPWTTLPTHSKNWDLGGDDYFFHTRGSLQSKQWDPGGYSLVQYEGPFDLETTWKETTLTQMHCPQHCSNFNLEDKVDFNGEGNVMILIEEKPSHQSGVNKTVREKGHVSADPIIQGIRLTKSMLSSCYKMEG